jgi:DNA end-binding protein Ku
MITLARQLIDRQTTTYDPSDIEDRYETRLRAMIDAKLKGEGIEDEETEEPDRGNVVDLMAALRKSLGDESAKSAKPGNAPGRAEGAPAAKTPKKKRTVATPAPKPTRKRA